MTSAVNRTLASLKGWNTRNANARGVDPARSWAQVRKRETLRAKEIVREREREKDDGDRGGGWDGGFDPEDWYELPEVEEVGGEKRYRTTT